MAEDFFAREDVVGHEVRSLFAGPPLADDESECSPILVELATGAALELTMRDPTREGIPKEVIQEQRWVRTQESLEVVALEAGVRSPCGLVVTDVVDCDSWFSFGLVLEGVSVLLYDVGMGPWQKYSLRHVELVDLSPNIVLRDFFDLHRRVFPTAEDTDRG